MGHVAGAVAVDEAGAGGQRVVAVVAAGGGVLGDGLARLLETHGVAAVSVDDGELAAVVRRCRATAVVCAGASGLGERRALQALGVRVVVCGEEGRDSRDADVVRVALSSDPLDLVAAVTGEPVSRRTSPRAEDGAARRARIVATGLTDRELDVLQQLMAGRSTAAIAQNLDISPHTVRTHVQNILGKLGVSTRLQAATLGHRLAIPPAGPAPTQRPSRSTRADRGDAWASA